MRFFNNVLNEAIIRLLEDDDTDVMISLVCVRFGVDDYDVCILQRVVTIPPCFKKLVYNF